MIVTTWQRGPGYWFANWTCVCSVELVITFQPGKILEAQNNRRSRPACRAFSAPRIFRFKNIKRARGALQYPRPAYIFPKKMWLAVTKVGTNTHQYPKNTPPISANTPRIPHQFPPIPLQKIYTNPQVGSEGMGSKARCLFHVHMF